MGRGQQKEGERLNIPAFPKRFTEKDETNSILNT